MLTTSPPDGSTSARGRDSWSRVRAASAAIAGLSATMMFITFALLVLALTAVDIFFPPVTELLRKSTG